MKTKIQKTIGALALVALFTLNLQLSTAHAQGTAFTYQGRLTDSGNPANGSYDLTYSLFDAGTNGNLIAGPLTKAATAVSNGLFTTTLDFGAGVFDGGERWLEIGVATNGSGVFTNLSPRQEITATPYAVTAQSANALPALSVQQNSDGAPNIIAGSKSNFVANGVEAATISGGGVANYGGGPTTYANSVLGSFGTVGGGGQNWAGSDATVSGGFGNNASYAAAIGGGVGNKAGGNGATIAGGVNNIASQSEATVGGGGENQATGSDSTVAGGDFNEAGGNHSFIGGGSDNTNSGDYAVIGGGLDNQATNRLATVSGGTNNIAGGLCSTVVGGQHNRALGIWSTAAGLESVASGPAATAIGASDTASGQYATAIGETCLASGYASTAAGYATIAGGDYSFAVGNNCNADGKYSVAMGDVAFARHQGTFVFADSQPAAFSSTANDQFLIRAQGGVGIDTGITVEGSVTINTNIYLDDHAIYLRGNSGSDHNHGLGYNGQTITNFGGGHYQVDGPALWGYNGGVLGTRNGGDFGALVWSPSGVSVYGTFNNLSDRNSKQDIAGISPARILQEVLRLPVSEWSYKVDAKTRHIGPMAQDFYSDFNVGTDNKHIAPIDEGGVALAAIQGLNEKLESRSKRAEGRIQKTEGQIKELKTENVKLQKQVGNLHSKVADLQSQLKSLQKTVARLADKSADGLAFNAPRQEER